MQLASGGVRSSIITAGKNRNIFRIDSSHCQSWTNLLVALDERDQCHSAISLESLVLVHCSSVPAIQSQLGVCHAQLNNFSMAEKYLQKALQLAPNSPMYRSNYDVLLRLKSKSRREHNLRVTG